MRGRSGRQGDPGESRFFLSLEDDLLRLFISDSRRDMMMRLGLTEDTPINARILSNSIESAQRRIEGMNFARRKNVITYDDVMNQQRNLIYKQRAEVLDGGDLSGMMNDMIHTVIRHATEECLAGHDSSAWNFDELRNRFSGLLTTSDSFRYSEEESAALSAEAIADELEEKALGIFAEKQKLFGAETFQEIERVILLRNVDTLWMDHLDAMEDLKGSVGLNAYAQRNPINEFRIIGTDMFEEMIGQIRERTVRMLLTVMPEQKIERREVAKPLTEGFEGGKMPQRKPAARAQKVGRNEPCPCGSGKKYKKCCGAHTE